MSFWSKLFKFREAPDRFHCSCCGQLHEGLASLSYAEPLPYEQLTLEERAAMGEITSDTCVIRYPDHTDRFIRVTLTIPIVDREEVLDYGVWVTLSEQNYEKYLSEFNNNNPEDSYFGWLSNRLPYFPDTFNLKTMVHPRSGGQRPWIELEPNDHPLAQAYQHGITWEMATEIYHASLTPN